MVEKDVYPIGRLDKDSEGLTILTNDTSFNAALLHPTNKHKRTYMVQVDNDINDKSIQQISQGVEIKLDSGTYKTKPCSVKKLQKPPVLPERNPPVRFRQNIPTSWALIELTEGKNRQVRKMFAAVGFPVLRLVRVQIEDLKLGKLEPGKHYTIQKDELIKLLHLTPESLKPKAAKKPHPLKVKAKAKPTSAKTSSKFNPNIKKKK